MTITSPLSAEPCEPLHDLPCKELRQALLLCSQPSGPIAVRTCGSNPCMDFSEDPTGPKCLAAFHCTVPGVSISVGGGASTAVKGPIRVEALVWETFWAREEKPLRAFCANKCGVALAADVLQPLRSGCGDDGRTTCGEWTQQAHGARGYGGGGHGPKAKTTRGCKEGAKT